MGSGTRALGERGAAALRKLDPQGSRSQPPILSGCPCAPGAQRTRPSQGSGGDWEGEAPPLSPVILFLWRHTRRGPSSEAAFSNQATQKGSPIGPLPLLKVASLKASHTGLHASVYVLKFYPDGDFYVLVSMHLMRLDNADHGHGEGTIVPARHLCQPAPHRDSLAPPASLPQKVLRGEGQLGAAREERRGKKTGVITYGQLDLFPTGRRVVKDSLRGDDQRGAISPSGTLGTAYLPLGTEFELSEPFPRCLRPTGGRKWVSDPEF